MRAVNLIPAGGRRTGFDLQTLRAPGPAVVAVLAVGLAMVTMYVLASNSVAQRRAELGSLNQQVAQAQAETGELTKYSQFTQLAQTRTATVRDIAASRFDWAATMTELSEVIPANTTLQSLTASVDTSATAGNSSSGGGALRGDIDVPAFELVGCTGSQDDVAGLMSRLRLINGVTRVTLSDAVQNIVGAAGSSTASSPLTCRPGTSTFDVVVFFNAPAGGPATSTPGAAPTTPTSTPTTTPTSTPTTTPTSTPTTTPGSTPTGGTS